MTKTEVEEKIKKSFEGLYDLMDADLAEFYTNLAIQCAHEMCHAEERVKPVTNIPQKLVPQDYLDSIKQSNSDMLNSDIETDNILVYPQVLAEGVNLKDGVYIGLWSGYLMEIFFKGDKLVSFKTNSGIRGVYARTELLIENGTVYELKKV